MVHVGIDRSNWNAEFARLRQFEPAVARSLRRNLREQGQETLGEIKSVLRLPPPNDQSGGVGSRDQIAHQTKFEVNFTKRSAGIRFRTTPGKLKGFTAAYNMKSFRHPVHGNRKQWVAQPGRPYFGSVITKDAAKKMIGRLENVIDEANKAIGAKF